MAKKFGFGTVLAVGAVAAAVGGGVAAYLNRESIKKTVQGIADKLGAQEEDGFFSVDLDEDIVVHAMDKDEADAESDFVDAEGAAEDMAEEAPAEESAAPTEEPEA